MKVVYAPRALRDLHEIESYLAERSPAGRCNVLAAIKRSIENLRDFPKIGIRLDDEVRYRLPVIRYPYLVFYRLDGAAREVLILHIRHGARRPVEPNEL